MPKKTPKNAGNPESSAAAPRARKPATPEQQQAQRERAARWSRESYSEVSEVGELPPVKDPGRKEACRLDLRRFLVTYFPETTGLTPFSADHDRVIERIQGCILHGGRYVNAVYRGFAKTTISENAALWAVLYGHRRSVPVIGADANAAKEIIDSLTTELEENDLLYEDFPEACHAIRALEGKHQRCQGQTYRGKLTHIEVKAEKIVLPRIPGSPASGAVLTARGITGGGRGLKRKDAGGQQLRPDFVIGDDLQTDESAATAPRVRKTLNWLKKKILRLGSHRKPLAIVINATVIEPDDAIDQLLDPDLNPSWDGERIPMVKRWADAHDTLWLEEYAKLRRTYDRDDPEGRKRAHAAATAFYQENRDAMDAGCEVSWASCFEEEFGEVSAIQHAYNILVDDGEEVFASECQNRPLRRVTDGGEAIVPATVAARLNGHDRGLVPAGVAHLTAFVDVGDRLLYYAVCGWLPDFTGHVVSYGTFPDQKRPYFTNREPPVPLQQAFAEAGQKGGLEAQLRWGLDALADRLLGREWGQDGGAVLRVGRYGVDSGDHPDVVLSFSRQSKHAAVILPTKGFGVGPGAMPLSERKLKADERPAGLHSYLSAPRSGLRVLQYDTNFWKSFLRERLQVGVGGRGSLALFGRDPDAHRLFADHLAAETFDPTTSDKTGRTVNVWSAKPGRPDNHWWDGLVGCAVLASILGADLENLPHVRRPQKREPVSLKEKQQAYRAQRARR